MAIYDYDTEIVGEQLTPPLLRQSKLLSYLYVLLSPIQNLWNLIFVEYRTGVIYFNYSGATTYPQFSKVIFSKKIYESIQVTTGNPPTDTNYWVEVSPSFIGVTERLSYNSQTIVLERNLNTYYQNLASVNQIYISNNSIISEVFAMGNSGSTSSSMDNSGSTSTTIMAINPTFNPQYNFTLFFPIALFNTLGNTNPNRELNIRGYVNKFILAGINYNITTY